MGGLGLLALTCAIAGAPILLTIFATGIVLTVAVAYFGAQHRAGVALAKDKVSRDLMMEMDMDSWRNHITVSIDDAHRDMLELLAMAGLVAFFGFQVLAGLGDVRLVKLGAMQFSEIELLSPIWLASYMIVVTGLTLVCYVRLRLSVGYFSLLLDPKDHPFDASTLDDAFFGLVILLVPISFDLFLLFTAMLPQWSGDLRGLVTGCIALLILVGERSLMASIGRSVKRNVDQSSPANAPTPT